MVYVNSKKFACESCIKGHRSSSCHHTDRPLFEIKKKGRPVSQCERCRELRQHKKVHSKCTCNAKNEMSSMTLTAAAKNKRFIPIVPALPNGLKDVLDAAQSSDSLPPDSRQRVDSLLNPCNCKSVWNCQCRTLPSSDSPVPQLEGMTTLAQAASMLCCNVATVVDDYPHSSVVGYSGTPRPRRSRPVTPTQPSHKRTKRIPSSNKRSVPGPELPPIQLAIPSSLVQLPNFPVMPPMSTINSLAGSGCTCGLQCACPGCEEHRGPQHAAKDRRSCADGCGTCIDRTIETVLPGLDSSAESSADTSFLSRFFACAAALPLPPDQDIMNSSTYCLTSRVQLPKLSGPLDKFGDILSSDLETDVSAKEPASRPRSCCC